METLGGRVWEPRLAQPLGGQLKVFLGSRPGVERAPVLEEAFDPEVLDAEHIAEAVLDAVWSLREHTPYGIQITRKDVNWGADLSVVEVIVDVSSVIASVCTVAELATRIRDRVKACGEKGQGDSRMS